MRIPPSLVGFARGASREVAPTGAKGRAGQAEPTTTQVSFGAVPGDQWRQFQARAEALAAAEVLSPRDSLLTG